MCTHRWRTCLHGCEMLFFGLRFLRHNFISRKPHYCFRPLTHTHTYSGVPQLQNTTHLLSCQSGVRCTFATVSLTTHSPPPRHAWHTHYNSPWSPWNSAKCLHRQLILSLQLPTFSPLQSRPVSPRSANQESLADFSGSRYKIQVATETGTREWTICSYRSLINDAPIAVPMNEQVCKWATSVRLQSEMQIPDLCPIDII